MKKGKPGYKHTALGWIPEDWEIKALGDCVFFLDGQRKPIKDSDRAGMQGEFPYYGASGIIDYVNNYIFDEDLILLGEDGANIVNRSTRLAFRVSGKIWVNNHAHVLRPKAMCEIGFLCEFLESMKYDKYNTGTAQPKLNQEVCSSIPIVVPPLPEQKAIAKVLSTWDKAIEKTEELIKQKELRKKYLMQQLLTGKKRLKGFSGEWKRYSYEELLKVVKRPIEWNDEELYHLISVRRRSGGIFQRESLYGKQILVKDLRTAVEGDFLFSKMQIVHGASALVTKEFSGAKISGSYIAVVSKNTELLNIEFFNWHSKTSYFYHQTYISSYGVHIEKMTFDFDNFLALHIRIPGIDEQTAITRILHKVDNEIDLLKLQHETLKLQKKGLMQVLLSGSKRIVKNFLSESQ